MLTRKSLLKWLAATPLAWTAAGSKPKAGPSIPQEEREALNLARRISERDFFNELGVRTLINATGTHTYLTGSLMRPSVVEAINATSTDFVNMHELQDRVGERLSEMIGCEAATVTAGAASALTLGTAACITGEDSEKIRQLPNLPGPQLEVIVQRRHRFSYDHAVRNCGIRFVEVETREELEAAINERTVMMLFFNVANYWGEIRDYDFVELGKKHGIPTFNDCAADVPPVENLWKYTDMGFDLVTVSGGKGLRGPQSAGLLMGRRDLIRAARLNTSPNGDTIGRGMKVNKEEIVGMMAAVEEYLAKDHEAHHQELERRTAYIRDAIEPIPGVQTERVIQEIGNHFPQTRIWWEEGDLDLDYDGLIEALRNGHPSIETARKGWLGEGVFVCLSMARKGQERTVARRLKEILSAAGG